MIEILNFSKKYKRNEEPVVKNVNLTARSGKITALLGLNGEGKTTLIKAICGVHYASSGKILVSSETEKIDVAESPAAAKKLLGYMSENSFLPEKLTVRELLYSTCRLFSVEDEKINSNVNEVLKDCELTEVQNKKINLLSKGFQQRVNLAQALVHKPENLILDEPVNGLDPAQIIQFRKIIKNVSKNKTVLLSTHLMQEVEALCDEINILHKGEIIFSGSKEAFLEKTGKNNLDEAFIEITQSKNE